MGLLGSPFCLWCSLLPTAWYLTVMLKVLADILGPWGKGQENYKQPWHSWASKPTPATAYLWTSRYMRQINPHVFQPLWSNFFFLYSQINVMLNWSTSTSSVLFSLAVSMLEMSPFLLTIFSPKSLLTKSYSSLKTRCKQQPLLGILFYALPI